MNRFSREHAAEILHAQGHEACVRCCLPFTEGSGMDIDAIAYLGSVYHYASGQLQDLEKAEAYYRAAAEGGSSAGQQGIFQLAFQYMHADISHNGVSLAKRIQVAKNLDKARTLLEVCEGFDDPQTAAWVDLGYAFLGQEYEYDGADNKSSRQNALACYRKSTRNGLAECQYWYADYMAYGSGRMNDPESYRYYLLSAGQGYVPAMLQLARFVSSGRHLFNFGTFLSQYGTAALCLLITCIPTVIVDCIFSQTLFAPPVWLEPARYFTNGVGIIGILFFFIYTLFQPPSNEKRAILSFMALTLSVIFIPLAQVLLRQLPGLHGWIGPVCGILTVLACLAVLAYLYIRTFRGFRTCETQALAWIRKAAETGDPRGLYKMGYCLYHGLHTKKNRKEGIRYFREAAQKENTDAMVELGHIYRHGIHLERSYDEAYRLYRRAADAGDCNGQYMVGYCYEKGISVEQDIKTAGRFYRDGRENGSGYAKKRLNRPMRLSLWDRTVSRWFSQSQKVKSLSSQLEQQQEIIGQLKEIIRKLDDLSRKMDTLTDTLLTQKKALIAVIRQEGDHVSEKVQEQFSTYCREVRYASVRLADLPEHQSIFRRQEEKLKRKFGSLWDKLQPESRTSLISARTMFDAAPSLADGSAFDYSGVCICATAALEGELSHYFLKKYIGHVRQTTPDMKRWPKVLTYKDTYTDELREQRKFTLGDLGSLLSETGGGSYLAGHLGKILKPEYRDRDHPAKWLREKYLPDGTPLDRSFADQVEQIRIHYRNPSAHSVPVSFEKAVGCMESIMGPWEAESHLNMTESVLYRLLNMLQ